MTNPLGLLKTQLQHEFTKTHTSEDYVQALSDGIYGCDLGVTALETWMNSWITPSYLNHKSEKDYVRGVEFVEQQWHQITGMF